MSMESRSVRTNITGVTNAERPRPWIHRRRTRPRGGFTLVELSVAFATVVILTGLATTSYQTYTMRARRSEAKLGLKSITLAQTAHFGEFSTYGDTFGEIGFPIEGGVRIDNRTIQATTYTFTVRALPLDGQSNRNFQGVATGDLDPGAGDGVLDILMVENQLLVLR
jgi:Tfp pilus assembly protein PilE